MLLAAIGPKNVELAAEVFDEWQPHLFHPGHIDSAFGPALVAGTAKRDPSLPLLRIVVHVNALITEDEAARQSAENTVRDYAVLYVGGMGAREELLQHPGPPLRVRRGIGHDPGSLPAGP